MSVGGGMVIGALYVGSVYAAFFLIARKIDRRRRRMTDDVAPAVSAGNEQ